MNSRVIEKNIITKYYEHLYSEDSFLKEIRIRKTLHAGGTRYSNGDKELVSPLKEMVVTAEISFDDVKNYRLETVAGSIYNIAAGFIEQVKKGMFKSLEELTTFTGQTVNAGGKPFSVDMFLDMLEKMEISFDKEGNPVMPSIVGASAALIEKIRNTKLTETQIERQKTIIEAKKREFYDKKHNRRLSYLD